MCVHGLHVCAHTHTSARKPGFASLSWRWSKTTPSHLTVRAE